MSFVSYGFAAFMVLCLLLYYIVPKKLRMYVLLTASMVFYALACRQYVIYIIVTIFSTYFFGRAISGLTVTCKSYIKQNKETLSKEEKKAYKSKIKGKQKRYLVICLLLNFGILGFLKYANFMILNGEKLRQLVAPTTYPFTFLNLVLPLGISFYTFQSMGYLIDLYYGKYEAEKRIGRFALFVTYFPQIIQGPISRFDDLSKTLFEGHDFSFDHLVHGFYLVMWGLFKKLIIADRVASFVQETVKTHDSLGGSYILLAIFFYSMEIYGDFSGGIDITIGVSRMFGVEVTQNFLRPFFSKSVSEYWRRWHITLGTWFKDYIFYPLSVAKWTTNLGKWIRTHINDSLGKKVPIYTAMFLVWFTTGLWHGAEWRYIIWGLLNFAILAFSTEMEPVYEKMNHVLHIKKGGLFQRTWQVFRTFWIMSFLRTFDIATGGVREAVSLIRGVFRAPFGFNLAVVEQLGLPFAEFKVAIAGCLILLAVSLLQRKESIYERIARQKLPIRWAFLTVLVLTVVIYGSYGMGYNARDFIYLQF